MDFNRIHIASTPISIASYPNHKEAVFLISVLDEPDLENRIIPKESGIKYHKTIIGYPILAKLVKDRKGNPIDFGGHEMTIKKKKDGTKEVKFDTIAIGSVIDSWIEDMEVDGYDGEKSCILIKTKLWTNRFPEYFMVFDKLWESGEIQSSWELTISKAEQSENNLILKAFEFIGNTVLGTRRTGAVPSAGVIQYAELSNYNLELANALERDLRVKDIDYFNKEEPNLAETIKDTIEGETAAAGTDSVVTNDAAKVDGIENPAVSENTDNENPQVADLTADDLRNRIQKACRQKTGVWCWISYFFPESKTVWVEYDGRATALDYKRFTYTVENDEVTVSEPEDVKLTVSVAEINDKVSELNKTIETLQAEIDIKNTAIVKASETVQVLNTKIAELEPYKTQVETSEAKRIETEIAEKKETLKKKMLKGNLFTETEIAESTEINGYIDTMNESAINNLIAERFVASIDEKSMEVSTETSVAEKIKTNLTTEETDTTNARAFMKSVLFKL